MISGIPEMNSYQSRQLTGYVVTTGQWSRDFILMKQNEP